MGMIREHALYRAEQAAAAVEALLAEPLPTSLPDAPDGLDGGEVAQALFVADLLAELDSQRGEDGHLPTRSAQETYATWAAHRDVVDPKARAEFDRLAERLDIAAEELTRWHEKREPSKPQKPERTGSAWT